VTGAPRKHAIRVVFGTIRAVGDDPPRGGEFLVTGDGTAERAGHLAPVALPGGDPALREPWRMAAAYLDAAGLDTDALADGVLGVRDRNAGQWPAALAMTRRRIKAPFTASAGVLFGAAAALLDLCDEAGDAGRAARDLERLADPAETGAYPSAIGPYRPPSREYRPPGGPGTQDGAGTFAVNGADLVRSAFTDLVAGVPRPVIAARFHHGVAAAIEAACLRLSEHRGAGAVTLDGDLFGNALLRGAVVSRLETLGLAVRVQSQVDSSR